MEILFITPRFPYPPLKGDQVVAYNRLKVLGQKHKITLLSFYENDEELANLDMLEPYCYAIHHVKLTRWNSFINLILKGPFSRLPLQVLYYRSATFQKCLDQLINSNNFDLIHVFLLRLAPYVADISTVKLLDLIDSMKLNLKRRCAAEKPLKRLLLREELRRINAYESDIGNSFDYLAVVSDIDKKYLPYKNVEVIPNGVDTNLFRPLPNISKTAQLVFTGNMGYFPNIQAIRWFVEKCFPLIKSQVPDVKLIIAGGNPASEVQKLDSVEGVTVLGYVKSMPKTLNSAHVSIAPMQSGSGIQNKILEAMACGLPVVTTTLGKGSIPAVSGKHIIVADDQAEFADAVTELLKSSQLAEEVGRESRNFVLEHYSWENVGAMVEEVYKRILGSST